MDAYKKIKEAKGMTLEYKSSGFKEGHYIWAVFKKDATYPLLSGHYESSKALSIVGAEVEFQDCVRDLAELAGLTIQDNDP